MEDWDITIRLAPEYRLHCVEGMKNLAPSATR